MVRIAVAGAMGRMGSRITALSREYEEIELAGVFEKKGHKGIGKDIGVLVGVGEMGIILEDDLGKVIDKADVLIDFTHTSSTLEHLRLASSKGKAMVIGTTGFTSDEIREVETLSRNIPCVLSPNMSVGINLLLKVIREIAIVLGDDYDIEIIEAHHRLKKDAPSGTAMKMAQVLASALKRDLNDVAVYARRGMIGERTKKEIGIQTIRAGDIVGEHTILFGGLGERIEITHKASSRDTFARGALKAALWVHGKVPGLYDMQDVLGLR